MKVDKKIRESLERMLLREAERIRSLYPGGRWVEIWCDYLTAQKEILFGHTDDVVEFFNENEDRFFDGVLLRDPAMIVGFVLVDWKFAEKALALGFPVDIVQFAESKNRKRVK